MPQFQCRLRVIWGGNPAFTVNQLNYLVAVKGSGKGSHFFLIMGTYRFSTSPEIFLNSRGHFTMSSLGVMFSDQLTDYSDLWPNLK